MHARRRRGSSWRGGMNYGKRTDNHHQRSASDGGAGDDAAGCAHWIPERLCRSGALCGHGRDRRVVSSARIGNLARHDSTGRHVTPCQCPTINGRRCHVVGCPNRGARNGSSVPYDVRRKRYGSEQGNAKVRLPDPLRTLARRCVDEGRQAEAERALEGVLGGTG